MATLRTSPNSASWKLLEEMLLEERKMQRLWSSISNVQKPAGTHISLLPGENVYPFLLATLDDPTNFYSSRILVKASKLPSLPAATNLRPEGAHIFLSQVGVFVDIFSPYGGSALRRLVNASPKAVLSAFTAEEIVEAHASYSRTRAHLQGLRKKKITNRLVRPFG